MDLAEYLYFRPTASDEALIAHISMIGSVIAFFIDFFFYDHGYFVEHVYKPLFETLFVFCFLFFYWMYEFYLFLKGLFLLIFTKLKEKAWSDILGDWVSALSKFFNKFGK